jgi:hypothetical protein
MPTEQLNAESARALTPDNDSSGITEEESPNPIMISSEEEEGVGGEDRDINRTRDNDPGEIPAQTRQNTCGPSVSKRVAATRGQKREGEAPGIGRAKDGDDPNPRPAKRRPLPWTEAARRVYEGSDPTSLGGGMLARAVKEVPKPQCTKDDHSDDLALLLKIRLFEAALHGVLKPLGELAEVLEGRARRGQ